MKETKMSTEANHIEALKRLDNNVTRIEALMKFALWERRHAFLDAVHEEGPRSVASVAREINLSRVRGHDLVTQARRERLLNESPPYLSFRPNGAPNLLDTLIDEMSR